MAYFQNDTARDYTYYRNSKRAKRPEERKPPLRRVLVRCPKCRYTWMVETDITSKKVYSVCGECGFKVEV